MKILKGQKGPKDYYDWLESVYGIDNLVVYDRRDAFPIDPTKKWGCDEDRQYPNYCSDYKNINIERWFKKEPIFGDKKRENIKKWKTNKVFEYNSQQKETEGLNWEKRTKIRNSWEEIKEGQVYHFILEIGFHHYIFEVERYLDDENDKILHLNYGLVEYKRIEKNEKISHAPICLCPITHEKYWWVGKENRFSVSDEDKEIRIDNPILYSTYIPKFIDANDVWNQLYEYISSLRDKEFEDSRTNDQHIESHGFDKKISFRHRK